MFFTTFGRVFYVEKNKKSHTNSENQSCPPFAGSLFRHSDSRLTLEIVPKAACDP
jgi:hypothetical protein